MELIHIIEQLSREKGIEKEILIDAVKSAVEAAARKKMPHLETLISKFNEITGEVEIHTEKNVVEQVEDSNLEISLEDAIKITPDAQLGETVLARQELENLGRIAAQLAKQVILQKVREAEIEITFNEFKDKKGELINGFVQRIEHGEIIVDLGKTEAILPRREQVFRESFSRGERIRAYVLDVRKSSKNTQVVLSRTHVGLIERLFELEVPEISEGMIEIMGIVREPNGRAKVAVRTSDGDIDAVGACVGVRGLRVQSIVQELRGEKIDIVEYSEDPELFVRNALSPAKISKIVTNRDDGQMTIIVADDQMSLAIGKKGQNVRLAAKLVKWKIDIKGESEATDLISTSSLFSTAPQKTERDFLETIKNAKGFGEKFVALLFNGNVVTYEQVVDLGVEGLVAIPGIGPKKAEALAAFVEDFLIKEKEEEENALSAENTASEDETGDETGADDTAISPEESSEDEIAPASLSKDEGTSDEVSGNELVEEEESEYMLEELVSVPPEVIACLKSNGFQTIAELSVTPIEELSSLEGIDESEARSALEKAKDHMDKFENV